MHLCMNAFTCIMCLYVSNCACLYVHTCICEHVCPHLYSVLKVRRLVIYYMRLNAAV